MRDLLSLPQYRSLNGEVAIFSCLGPEWSKNQSLFWSHLPVTTPAKLALCHPWYHPSKVGDWSHAPKMGGSTSRAFGVWSPCSFVQLSQRAPCRPPLTLHTSKQAVSYQLRPVCLLPECSEILRTFKIALQHQLPFSPTVSVS